MPLFIEDWFYHMLERWEESKTKDFCSIILGLILSVAATVIGTLSWMKGVSSMFVVLDLLAASMIFMWSCLKGAEHISSGWEIFKILRIICSMILGAAFFISGAAFGMLNMLNGAPGLFVIMNFISGTLGLMWMCFKAVEIWSLCLEGIVNWTYESIELNETSHVLNNEIITSRGDNEYRHEMSTSPDVKITKSEIDFLVESLCRFRSTDFAQQVVNSEEAKRVCRMETRICEELHVTGPVPGGRYIPKTEKRTNSISQSPEGIYVPGNTAQRSYVRSSSQSTQQPQASQNSIEDSRSEMSHITSLPVDESATEDPYVICQRIDKHNTRSFDNQSYESSELFGTSPRKVPKCANDSSNDASILCRYPMKHSICSPNKPASTNTDDNPVCSEKERYVTIQHTLPIGKTDFTAEYSIPKSNLLTNPDSVCSPPVIPPKTSYAPTTNRRPLPPIPAPRRLPRNPDDLALIHASPPLPAPRRIFVNSHIQELSAVRRGYPPIARRSPNIGPSGRIPVVPSVLPHRMNISVHSQLRSPPPPPIPKKQFMKY